MNPEIRVLAAIGDYSPDVPAHRAIPLAMALAAAAEDCDIAVQWFHTSTVRDAAHDLTGCDAVWLVPASPYANMSGAIESVRWARETGRPFLGTCGGFQHAIIEFARNVAGLAEADHAESNPNAAVPIIKPLACSFVEKSGGLRFVQGTCLERAYGAPGAVEEYHCSYGFNSDFRNKLEEAGLRFSGFDARSEVRAFELPTHPFFVGTLFQPERSALRGEVHPLIRAFARAIRPPTIQKAALP